MYSEGVVGQTNPTFYGADGDKKPTRRKKNFKNCTVCSKCHTIWKHKEYLAMKDKKSRSIVRKKRLCYRCLSPDHSGVGCPRKSVCGIEKLTKHSLPVLTSRRKRCDDDERFSHTVMGAGESTSNNSDYCT